MRLGGVTTGNRDSRGSVGAAFVAILVLVTVFGALAVLVTDGALDTEEGLAGPEDASQPFERDAAGPAAYEGYTYSPHVMRPTAATAQSKLWFADGTWWGLLVNPGDDSVHIYELTETHVWRDTGNLVDARAGSRGDALWDETRQRVVVASRADRGAVRVATFEYDSEDRSWAPAVGSPQEIDTGGRGPESVSVDVDSTGRLWLTYTQGGEVLVAHSDPDGRSWTAGFPPAGADTDVDTDDISAIIAFDSDGSGSGNDSIGVLWSDQESDAFRFAIHRDGSADSAWSHETPLAGEDVADDHLSVKIMPGRHGDAVLAAVKTSMNEGDDPNAPLVGVLVRKAGGTGQWSLVPAGTVVDAHSRPLLLVDAENRELLLFATARPLGSDVYLKRTSFSDLSFPAGRGKPFLVHGPPVQDVTGTKQVASGLSGVVVLVSSRGEHGYVHAESAIKAKETRR